MPFTLGAYSESEDIATLANLAAVADAHLRVEGDNIIVPRLDKLWAVYFGGVNITLARVDAPSLRDILLPDLEPLDRSAEPSVPTPLVDFSGSPLQLEQGEPLRALAAEDGAGATRRRALYWLGTEKIPPPPGEIQRIRATSATATAAEAWSNLALTFDQTLKAGWYAVVGMFARSTGMVAARLVSPGLSWRPGCIGYDAVGDDGHPLFRSGRLGVWTIFKNESPPTVDVLSASADTDTVVVIDAIYLGKEDPTELLTALR